MRTFVIAALFASANALSLTQLQYLSDAPAKNATAAAFARPADCKENDERADCKKAAFARPADCKENDERADCKKAAFARPADCKKDDERADCKAAAFGDDHGKKNETKAAFADPACVKGDAREECKGAAFARPADC